MHRLAIFDVVMRRWLADHGARIVHIENKVGIELLEADEEEDALCMPFGRLRADVSRAARLAMVSVSVKFDEAWPWRSGNASVHRRAYETRFTENEVPRYTYIRKRIPGYMFTEHIELTRSRRTIPIGSNTRALEFAE